LARGNYRDYLKGGEVWVKKYFYGLRPLLAIRWIERDLGPVPMELQKLVESTVDAADLRTEIERLVAAKRDGAELDYGPRIESISVFIDLVRFDDEQEATEDLTAARNSTQFWAGLGSSIVVLSPDTVTPANRFESRSPSRPFADTNGARRDHGEAARHFSATTSERVGNECRLPRRGEAIQANQDHTQCDTPLAIDKLTEVSVGRQEE